jgi:hypothetical protein
LSGGVTLDFEGYTSNGDGTYALPGDDVYPTYGGVGRGIVDQLEADGVTTRTMLKIEKGATAEVWAGINLAHEYTGTNFIGDGSLPITMRVFAEQDGALQLELEVEGQDNFVVSQNVTQGWNDVSFDVSGAADANWERVQLRPDSGTTGTKTVYLIDDVRFPQAVIEQTPTQPTTDAFLNGATTPTASSAGVVSLFSDEYTSSLNGVDAASWSSTRGGVAEVTLNNGNTVKQFNDTLYAGFEISGGVSTAGMDTLNLSIYRDDASDFEVKLVDLGAGANGAAVEDVFVIPAADMAVNQWSTVSLSLKTVAQIDQVVLKPMGGSETFYMDDIYLSGGVTLDFEGFTSNGNGTYALPGDDVYPTYGGVGRSQNKPKRGTGR